MSLLLEEKAKICFEVTYIRVEKTEVVLCGRILVDGDNLNLQP